MLKMYIDNEEVVSKNDFTIKEEMLSASSTILNNTYPKSWEQDKDYISRFYYPKDYSKLILNKDTYYPHIDGETIEGSNFQIQADTTLEDSYYFEGNTIQDGTPTPTNPQPIQVVTGNQEIEVCGKNLLDNNAITLGGNWNGSAGTICYPFENQTNRAVVLIPVKPSTSYHITLQQSEWYVMQCMYTTSDYTVIGNALTTNTNEMNTTITTTSNTSYIGFKFKYGSAGTTTMTSSLLSELKLQLEKGQVGTEYEPYIGNTYSINLGKNLLDIPNGTYSNNGITATVDNGVITLNGTATSNSYVNITLIENITISSGSYTYSLNNATTGTTEIRLFDTNNSYTSLWATSVNNKRINNDSRTFNLMSIVTTRGNTLNNLVLKPQVEKGSIATSFSPYFTPIELCKINTYQDRIFKSSGKNLLDLSNYSGRLNCNINEDGSITSNISNSYYCELQYTYLNDFLLANIGKTFTYSMANGISGKFMSVVIFGTRTGGASYQEISSYTGENHVTFTIADDFTNITEIRLRFNRAGTPFTDTTTKVSCLQLVEGGSVLPYEPYLAKGKWYLYKEIGKEIYDGSSDENWQTSGTNPLFYIKLQNDVVYKASVPQYNFCNYFNNASISSTNSVIGYWVLDNSYIRIRPDNTTTSVATFKTWLSTHNTIVYYVLATPTYTEITNEELISQLNSIELIDGLNNISITSSNLSMIMNLHYNYQTEHTNSELIFSGMVKNTNNISLNPREPKYCSLEILDYKTLLSEGKTLDYVISNKTILEAISMVVNSISEYGFELGNVNILNGDEIIGAYSTENKTAYDVLQYLADISSAKWNCRRKDNTNMYIDFYDPTLMPRGKQIEYTNEWACENNLCDIKFNYGTRDYRNKQIILSDEVEGSIEYNDRVVSDGVNKEYTLPYKIATLNKIEIDGIEQSIATKEEKEVGIYADFYYSRDTDTFTSNKLLPYGTLIDVSYTPIIKGREVVQNDSEIDRLTNQLEVNGTISRYENRNDTTDTNKLINIGETYLKYKGEAEITLTIKTENNNLYNVGQVVYFNAPIPELQKDYLVKSKQIQVISSDEDELNIFYTFTLSSSFNAEKEINWFDNQRAKMEGNIGEGEFISRNIDINSKANIIWDNLRVEEVDLPVGANNDLQASLESPLIH